MMSVIVPGAEHYREIAEKLREVISSPAPEGRYCISLHASKPAPIISTAGRDR